MASEPLWNQNHDRNYSRVSESSSYPNPETETWFRQHEGGDSETGGTAAINGSHLNSDTESSTQNTTFTKTNMTSNGSGDSTNTVGESVSHSRQDRIASIFDNPFYKSFGVRHPRSPRDITTLPQSSKTSDADSGAVLREELGDYKPGSGFVHKLRGKFASLGIRDEAPLNVKQTSSLEEINGGSKSADVGIKSYEAEISPRERARQKPLVLTYNTKYRAKSVDSLNHTHRKPHLPVTLRHVERKWEAPPSPTKSPRESHIIAPDVKLARDDIILIENTPPPPPPPQDESSEEDEGDTSSPINIASFKAEMPTNELPKPNTVSTFRNFFESASHTDTDQVKQNSGDQESRDISLTPQESGLTPRESVLTPRDSVLSPREPASTPRDSVLTPRDLSSSDPSESLTPRDPAQTLSPRGNDSTSKAFDFSHFSSRYDASRSRFSHAQDNRAAGSSDWTPAASTSTTGPSSPLSYSSLPTASSSTAVTTTADSAKLDDAPSVSETAASLTVAGSKEGSRPLVSPRSTAAVKAVPSTRPPIPSRPARTNSAGLPNSGASVPPSFTPSIKKTSPVMPVAPFKDKQDDDDENRHLIYVSKRPASRPNHPARVRDYQDLPMDNPSDPVKKMIEEKEKMEVESKVEKTNRVNLSQGKRNAPPIPRQRPGRAKTDKTEDVHLDLSMPVSPRIEDSQPKLPEPAQSVKAPTVAPRTFFADSKQKEDEPGSEPVNDTSEEPPSAGEEPVRGIPSIIAKRMKQNQTDSEQSAPPGELFGVRLGKTRHTDSGDDGSEIPSKRLAAMSDPQKRDDTTASNLPSEIENQIASVRKRMQATSKKKPSGVSQIFDSSQLARKRKENQEARKRAAAKANVPRLDLSSITSDEGGDPAATGGYRVTPREIKPCNIEFVGANVSLGRSLLQKNRKVKINIRFHDTLVKTFEYPSEEAMLENYMREHPDDVLVLEESSGPAESSDDTDLLDTPRGGGGGLESELLKSNTALSHSGSLQSYRGKYQQEYVLGSVLNEPERPAEPVPQTEQEDPDSLQLRPAVEDDLDTWSTSTTSDLLF